MYINTKFFVHFAVNIEDPTGSAAKRPKKEKEPEKPKKVVVVVGAQPEEVGTESVQKEKGTEKASDDFHFEKFKKQFRRF